MSRSERQKTEREFRSIDDVRKAFYPEPVPVPERPSTVPQSPPRPSEEELSNQLIDALREVS